ncbi:hypothetical protein [Litoribacter populi]|uniref:hypothetical protein n=1 Tax=Litoribacter populi TaxID=2598460 RepID=UPI0011811205|nr:hypothetical protein [Litoribacter populi]
MNDIVDRIGEFAKVRNISIRKIEHAIGASNGTLSKSIGKERDIQTRWLAKFMVEFPEVNPTWLLTGKGSVLLNSEGHQPPRMDDPIQDYPLFQNQTEEVIHSLKKVIHALEGQLEEKEKVVQLKDRIIRDLEEEVEELRKKLEGKK